MRIAIWQLVGLGLSDRMKWKYPLIPIHNNQVESYIREKVVRRKISGGHKNDRGAAACNMWISLYQTVRKNGVSFLLYLQDRFKDLNQIPQLSVIIELRA